MPRNVTEILKEAMELSVEERATLADSLLDSLDPQIETLWLSEAERRAHELDSGVTRSIPWLEVRSQLRSAFTKER
jgi:putative addiction module component (TIGR02574 family)